MNNNYLPLEICNKILLYNIHPVAEIIKKHNIPMIKFIRILKYMKRGHEKMCEEYAADDPDDDGIEVICFHMFYLLSDLNPWRDGVYL